jgi:hypothetical protein
MLVTGEEWGRGQGEGTRRVDEWRRWRGRDRANLTRGDVGDESSGRQVYQIDLTASAIR